MTNKTTIPDLRESRLFESHYIRMRQAEGRLYNDREAMLLPTVSKQHLHYQEWKVRAASFQKLIEYLKRKKYFLNILEVGCGNGWLSNHLATLPNVNVTGIDINKTELDQAKRLFKRENLSFIEVDIRDKFLSKQFDIVVFAAAFQYFDSATTILNAVLGHLNARGEVHIIDTHFYTEKRKIEAIKRSESYFQSLNMEEMTQYYFHHTNQEFTSYSYKILNPFGLMKSRLLGHRTVFPWICIKKTAC